MYKDDIVKGAQQHHLAYPTQKLKMTSRFSEISAHLYLPPKHWLWLALVGVKRVQLFLYWKGFSTKGDHSDRWKWYICVWCLLVEVYNWNRLPRTCSFFTWPLQRTLNMEVGTRNKWRRCDWSSKSCEYSWLHNIHNKGKKSSFLGYISIYHNRNLNNIFNLFRSTLESLICFKTQWH